MKKKIIYFIVAIFMIANCLFFSVRAEDIIEENTNEVTVGEDYLENDGQSTDKTLTQDEINQIIKDAITAYEDGDASGFLEKYLPTILASLSGSITAIGVLLYWVLKALKESKGLTKKLEETGKLTKDNADTINAITTSIENIVSKKVDVIITQLEDQIGETCKVREEFNSVIATLNESDKEWFSILKNAMLNDNHYAEGTLTYIKELFENYEKKYIGNETKEE